MFVCLQRSPLSATQLLWVNLIMDALASLALTRDPPSNDVLTHKPYGRHKPLVSRMVLRNVIFHSIYQLTVMFILMFVFPDFLDMRDGYDESSVCRPTQHGTMVFTTFVFMTLFNEINCRRVLDRNVFYGLLYGKLTDINYVFIVIWILSFGIQVSQYQWINSVALTFQWSYAFALAFLFVYRCNWFKDAAFLTSQGKGNASQSCLGLPRFSPFGGGCIFLLQALIGPFVWFLLF